MQIQFESTDMGQTFTIPNNILKDAGLPTGATYFMEIINGTIMIYPVNKHKTLEDIAAKYGGVLEPAGEFDWGEPVGREVTL